MLTEILKISKFMLEAYIHAWPYLLITIPLAVLVNVSGISQYINRALSAKPLLAIFLATAVGAFSPFCSCGVIPVITALLIGGVPLAPVMSFWLASPSMDPEIFFLSVSQLGMDLAVWRLAATFVMSLAGGYITHYLIKIKWLGKEVMKQKIESNNTVARIPVLAAACCSPEGSENGEDSKSDSSFHFKKLNLESEVESCPTGSCGKSEKSVLPFKILMESKKAIIMILKFMTLAFFLEALIILYVPEPWIISILGQDNSFAIPVSALIGIPLYTTNLTALGLMGGLLQQGMASGAVLAFLIGGATTTIPAMAAIYGIVKKRVFFLYLSFSLGAALISGYLYQMLQN